MMLSNAEIEIVILSLKVALTAVAFSLPFGIAAAWILARCAFPGRGVISGLVHLPLVLPPVVTGYGLLVLLGPDGPIGGRLDALGIRFAFDWTGAALAAAVMGFPLMVRSIRLAFDMADPGLEQAAESLGASPLSRFLTITLPLALPGVVAGAVLAFAKAMGEFGATITFVSNIPGETRTLPLAIYSLSQLPGSDKATLRLVLISVSVSVLALVASEWLAHRGIRGRSGA